MTLSYVFPKPSANIAIRDVDDETINQLLDFVIAPKNRSSILAGRKVGLSRVVIELVEGIDLTAIAALIGKADGGDRIILHIWISEGVHLEKVALPEIAVKAIHLLNISDIRLNSMPPYNDEEA